MGILPLILKGDVIMDKDLSFEEDLGISEEEVDFRFREAVRLAKERKRIMGKPTCEYDVEKKAPYFLYPDGHREYPDFDNV